jgi:hypothetical protein
VLKYYEDIDVIEAEDVMLEFLSPHDREEFKRVYLKTKKAWHEERMLLNDDVPVNAKPGRTPRPPDGVGNPPIPSKKARLVVIPSATSGGQSASSTRTQSRHNSALEEKYTIVRNQTFLAVPQSRPFGGSPGRNSGRTSGTESRSGRHADNGRFDGYAVDYGNSVSIGGPDRLKQRRSYPKTPSPGTGSLFQPNDDKLIPPISELSLESIPAELYSPPTGSDNMLNSYGATRDRDSSSQNSHHGQHQADSEHGSLSLTPRRETPRTQEEDEGESRADLSTPFNNSLPPTEHEISIQITPGDSYQSRKIPVGLPLTTKPDSISDPTQLTPAFAPKSPVRDLATGDQMVDDQAQHNPTQMIDELPLGDHNAHENSRPDDNIYEFAESTIRTLVDEETAMSIKGPLVSDRPYSDRGVESDTTKVNENEVSTTLLAPFPEEKFDDMDIRSLISEGDDGALEASRPLPAWSLQTENAIISVLAKSSVLTPLYERALQLMSRDRFINNFRRLLKGFHTDLLGEMQEPLMTRQLAAILRTRERRGRMARKIVFRYLSDVDAYSSMEDDLVRLENQDNNHYAFLDLWLHKQPTLSPKVDYQDIDRQEEKPDGPDRPDKTDEPHEPHKAHELYRLEGPDVAYEHTDHDSEKDDSDDSLADPEDDDESIHGDFEKFPRLDMVMKTLVKGRPFQDMITGVKELLLPFGLLDEILPIPRAHIRYDSTEETNILSSFQGLIEDITALPWDWWPLPPKMRKLGSDETRVYWRCVSMPAEAGHMQALTYLVLRDDALVRVETRTTSNLGRAPQTGTSEPSSLSTLCLSSQEHKSISNESRFWTFV